jgi:hypothetical protein
MATLESVADDDPLHLALEDTDVDNIYKLLQWYSLAVLYETIIESGWEDNNGKSADVIATCSSGLTGVKCDDSGVITKLNLGESNVKVVSHCLQSSITTMITRSIELSHSSNNHFAFPFRK